jgi:hypothetical protein
MSFFSPNIDFAIVIALILVIIIILSREPIKLFIKSLKADRKFLNASNKQIKILAWLSLFIEISIVIIMVWPAGAFINEWREANKIETINGVVNKKIKVDNLNVTLNSITKKEEICGINYADECIQPTQKYLIVINITIKNNGTENHSETVFNHELKDSNKNDYIQENAWSGNGEYNPIATILPGKAVNMNIIYDVKDADNYYFYYTNQNTANNIKFNIANNDIK